MNRITKKFPLAAVFSVLVPFAGAANAHTAFLSASQTAQCQQKAGLSAPIIRKVVRSERTEGVWHDIFVKYQGQPNQKLKLQLFWDAQTPSETGKGTSNSKSQFVRTDKSGQGNWKMKVKGYPAGKIRARVIKLNGEKSQLSPKYDMPWLF